ncbi:MAG TPA: hypothetical protein VJ844_01935, partial [Mucilaginibacter sp.]|nr:hypothetical protein [Mucilaginibacter sp.]
MKIAIKEFIWLLGILILAWLTYGKIMGNSALDINLHDTYIVTAGWIQTPATTLFLFTWFIIFGFVIYLTRALFFEFKVVVT